jgi:hypothetical protein
MQVVAALVVKFLLFVTPALVAPIILCGNEVDVKNAV